MSDRQYWCYILRNTSDQYSNYTYCGYTVDPIKRLRQHNEEIKGGACATHGKNHAWVFMFLMTGFKTSNNALSCEWRIKHPGKKYKGVAGRIHAINDILQLSTWSSKCNIDNADCNYDVFVDDDVYCKINPTKDNITLHNTKMYNKAYEGLLAEKLKQYLPRKRIAAPILVAKLESSNANDSNNDSNNDGDDNDDNDDNNDSDAIATESD